MLPVGSTSSSAVATRSASLSPSKCPTMMWPSAIPFHVRKPEIPSGRRSTARQRLSVWPTVPPLSSVRRLVRRPVGRRPSPVMRRITRPKRPWRSLQSSVWATHSRAFSPFRQSLPQLERLTSASAKVLPPRTKGCGCSSVRLAFRRPIAAATSPTTSRDGVTP